MEDKDLERKIEATREAIHASDLHDMHKEALHESLDEAAKSANGSTEKLHDLTVAFCKSVIRSARSDVSFKTRVADAVQGPLDAMRDELIAAVTNILSEHTIQCPNKAEIEELKRFPHDKPTTWKDVARDAVKSRWCCTAVAMLGFSPAAIELVKWYFNK